MRDVDTGLSLITKRTLFGVKLNGETTRITSRVWRALLSSNSGEAGNTVGLLANSTEHVHAGEIGHIMGNLEGAIGTSSLGMNYALGDPFTCMRSASCQLLGVRIATHVVYLRRDHIIRDTYDQSERACRRG